MKTEIVDKHHKVLASWAKLRRELSIAPRLLSLDFHTDTSRPFRNFSSSMSTQKQLLSNVNYQSVASVDAAIQKLNNDEHIVTAIESNIISAAFIIAQNATTTDQNTFHQHKIACFSAAPRSPLNNPTREDCDRVLETEFLKQAEVHFNRILQHSLETTLTESPFILDIDLDFFCTHKSIAPTDKEQILFWAKKASLITIATEPDYVQNCSLDKDLHSEYLLENLMRLLN